MGMLLRRHRLANAETEPLSPYENRPIKELVELIKGRGMVIPKGSKKEDIVKILKDSDAADGHAKE